MFRSSFVRIAAITVAALVALGLLHSRAERRATWSSPPGAAPARVGRQQLSVGFLPVT